MNPNLIVLKRGHIPLFSSRKTTRENFRLWINQTYSIILLFIWFLWIYYVWTLNVNATKWYNVRNLEIEKNQIIAENELLDIKIAELESLSYILDSKQIKNMVPIEEKNYLVLKDRNYAYNN